MERNDDDYDPYRAQREAAEEAAIEAVSSAFPGASRSEVLDLLGVGEGGGSLETEIVDVAFRAVDERTRSQLAQLEENYQLARRQAQGWYRASLAAAVFGFLLLAAGVVFAMAGRVAPGLISMASGMIPEVAAALFFRQSKAANERVDGIQRINLQQRQFQLAIALVATISESSLRDKLKEEFVQTLFYPSSSHLTRAQAFTRRPFEM
jgi:hypothetical protein